MKIKVIRGKQNEEVYDGEWKRSSIPRQGDHININDIGLSAIVSHVIYLYDMDRLVRVEVII